VIANFGEGRRIAGGAVDGRSPRATLGCSIKPESLASVRSLTVAVPLDGARAWLAGWSVGAVDTFGKSTLLALRGVRALPGWTDWQSVRRLPTCPTKSAEDISNRYFGWNLKSLMAIWSLPGM
jgi:hypothetical protein